ncbi:MAG: arginase family protein [Acetobacteraceae bacterium]|nr:arginase family protein [Acetobacteraceae bacterium]
MFADADLFAPPPSFLGAPHGLPEPGCRAAFLGVPFDCGVNPRRIGSRQGPLAVRLASWQVRRFNATAADFDPVARLGLVDAGDVRLTPGRVAESFPRIEAALARVMRDGAIPVTMGGDGAISLPIMRAVARRHPGLVALHIDSHTDAKPWREADGHDSGNQFTAAVREGLVDAARSWHVGVRGTIHAAGRVPFAESLGFRVVSMEALMARGFAQMAAEFAEVAAGRPVCLCWDMDVFDPAAAPGVVSPNWGGLSAREGIALMRALTGLDIVAVDINTVSPPHDPHEITASLAAQITHEALVLLCRKLGLDAPAEPEMT